MRAGPSTMPSQSWQFKTAHLPKSHLLVFSHIPSLLLQLKPSNLYSSLSDALFWWVCWGSTRRRCPELCRRSPSSQQARNWKHSHVFSFCSSRVTSQNFLARPHTAIIKLFPTPKVIGRHSYWIFLHVAYFSPPPPFFLLNKHAHFPIFPSPNSLASFPLHKRCQETRSVKQCAAFLNNCVTAWNGTCESFKKPQRALKVSQKKGNKTSPNKITKVLQIPVFQLRFTQVSPTKPEVSPETFCSGVSSAKISRKGWESTGLTGTSLSRLTRSYPPLTIEGNEQWGTEEAFGMDPSLMNRGGENSQELKGVKESQVKLSFQEDNDLRKSSGDLPSGGPSAAQVTSH